MGIYIETEEELVEKLADLEHARWSRWQHYLHSQCEKDGMGNLIIPADRVAHWERQFDTPYKELTEREKESDRKEVREYLPIVKRFFSK